MPRVPTMHSRTRTASTSFAIVQSLDYALELADIGPRQFSMLTEMLHQGRQPAIEYTTEQRFTLRGDPLLAGERRGVDVAATLLPGTNGALLRQAREQCL